MKQVTLLLAGMLCLAQAGWSQGTLKGRLADSTTKTPLALATITVFNAGDTSILTYRLSSPDGDFKVPGLPLQLACRMLVSFNGYEGFRKEFTLTEASPTLDLGEILLNKTSKTLDEVTIFSERPPVIVKQDTIEFNASAFKTLPDALVEDLLKKLPGVQVDKEGNITVNGKPVNRILVDGKTFFGDDPKMATRNLPVNVIDKVQVTDDKEEMLRSDIINPNDVGKLVNITLKKGVKKGWFGKLYAGAGTQHVYEAGGIANIYRDTLQVSLLGYMNNLNRPGFSYGELMQAGGLDRNRGLSNGTSISNWRSSNGSGVSINGINFGGSQNYGGVATSKGYGVNINHTPGTKRSFFVQYFRGNVSIDRTNSTNTHQFMADTVLSNDRLLSGDVVTNAHNIGTGLRLKPDSLTNILINANYTIGLQDEERWSNITSRNNFAGILSEGNIIQNNPATSHYYRHNVAITRLSGRKKGRRLNFTQGLDLNNRLNDYQSDYLLHYRYPSGYDSALSQLRQERIPQTTVVTTGLFSEPISKKTNFRLGIRHDYNELHNQVSTYNKGNGSDKFDQLNTALSSDFRRRGYRFLFTTGFEFKFKVLSISPTLRYQVLDYKNVLSSSGKSVDQQINSWLPALSVTYKKLSVNYNKDVYLPGYNYLLPVTDNTNPFYITRGNTGLLPSERHNISVNYAYNNPKTNIYAFLYAAGSYVNNDVIQAVVVDDKGVQTTTPVNANGTKNLSVNYDFGKQFKNNPKFMVNFHIGAYDSYNQSLLLYNNTVNEQKTVLLNNWLGLGLNINDKVELNTSLQVGFNFTRYGGSVFKPINTRFTWFDQQVVVRLPKRLAWETSYNVDYNSALPKASRYIQRWNAALSYTALASKALVFRLSVFDILETNINFTSFAGRNAITTNRTNTLPQYFMLTGTYNVRPKINSDKKPGKRNMFLF